MYKWTIWSQIDKVFIEKPCKGATAKEKDNDVWLKIDLIYRCQIVERFISYFKQQRGAWCF